MEDLGKLLAGGGTIPREEIIRCASSKDPDLLALLSHVLAFYSDRIQPPLTSIDVDHLFAELLETAAGWADGAGRSGDAFAKVADAARSWLLEIVSGGPESSSRHAVAERTIRSALKSAGPKGLSTLVAWTVRPLAERAPELVAGWRDEPKLSSVADDALAWAQYVIPRREVARAVGDIVSRLLADRGVQPLGLDVPSFGSDSVVLRWSEGGESAFALHLTLDPKEALSGREEPELDLHRMALHAVDRRKWAKSHWMENETEVVFPLFRRDSRG